MNFEGYRSDLIDALGVDHSISDIEIFHNICEAIGLTDDITPSELLFQLEECYLAELIELFKLPNTSEWKDIKTYYNQHFKTDPDRFDSAKLVQLNKFSTSWKELYEFLDYVSKTKEREL
ncbi:hypothetical protein KC669_03790 [Candidatus Dojkabacteria bacterium]|uniref:Uncharacterized protein n=1 Tax=Candidatus Dojkabacteria bacterium TaxID=2099670 RepID=A0A955RLJ1_9BACT|nr:hypothetical protein [Candidatus Dojkabacteria bacterium]